MTDTSECLRCGQNEAYGCNCTSQEMAKFYADRIEALEAENARLKLAVSHANDHADAAIADKDAAEAKLAKVRDDAFERAAQIADEWATDTQRVHGNGGPAAAIRELKGGDA